MIFRKRSCRKCPVRLVAACLSGLLLGLPVLFAADPPPASNGVPLDTVRPDITSEDSQISHFHSLGEIAGRTNIYRCASPVGVVADRLTGGLVPAEPDRQEARARMQHLYDLGVRTVVSLQRQEPPTETWKNPEYIAVSLEQDAAREVGITYVAYSMSNKGKDALSLQYMSDDAVYKLMETIGDDIVKRSETGGVAFHCKSGKDRTGLVAAYLRVKYQRWSAEEAIVEMRQNGHVWKSFLKPGNSCSWHEQHLRNIAARLASVR